VQAQAVDWALLTPVNVLQPLELHKTPYRAGSLGEMEHCVSPLKVLKMIWMEPGKI
jgi:hypothetical protein